MRYQTNARVCSIELQTYRYLTIKDKNKKAKGTKKENLSLKIINFLWK